MSLLAVCLSTSDEPDSRRSYSFALLSEGLTVLDHGQAAVNALPHARATEVVAVVPESALSWHLVQLPKGVGTSLGARRFSGASARDRIRAVLGGILEEHLLDEVADLHFSLQPQPKADAPAWVAVCSRSWLSSSVAKLREAGIKVDRIVALLAPGFGDQTSLHFLQDDQGDKLVAVDSKGVRRLPLSAEALSFTELTGLTELSDKAEAFSQPALAEKAEALLQRNVQVRTKAQSLAVAIDRNCNLDPYGIYSGKQNSWLATLRSGWTTLMQSPQWLPARIALAAILLINLAGINAWAWAEKSRWVSAREEMRRILTSTFPETNVVIDAPRQMARQVAMLRQSSAQLGASDLESMLLALAQALPADAKPASYEFDSGKLVIGGLDINASQLDAINASLAAVNYSLQKNGADKTWLMREKSS